MAGDVIVYVTYGIDVLPSDDPYISLAKDVAHITTIAAVPGRFLIVSLGSAHPLPTLTDVSGRIPAFEARPKVALWRRI